MTPTLQNEQDTDRLLTIETADDHQLIEHMKELAREMAEEIKRETIAEEEAMRCGI